jgi:ABC-type Fe3+-siderophore transport system permease subunit
MLRQIIHIAVLCIVFGGASIPISFNVSNSPVIVWVGNTLGSAISALVVIYIGNKITNRQSEEKLSKKHFTKKIVTVFEEGGDNKKVQKARILIDQHGLRIFSLLCPIFPGVLVSTVAVYAIDRDKTTYKRWMLAGVVFVSGFYVFSYWAAFVR